VFIFNANIIAPPYIRGADTEESKLRVAAPALAQSLAETLAAV